MSPAFLIPSPAGPAIFQLKLVMIQFNYYMGRLYIVSTPIGNIKDISIRAIEVLSQVDLILCEDTRRTGSLLKKLKINRPRFLSFYEENEEKRIMQVIRKLIEGQQIALVSSAGTPLLSDPGFKLVRECVKQKINLVSVPGPSALLAGLVISGLPMDKFMFLGFLPKKRGKKTRLLETVFKAVEFMPQTVIFYESPFRILKTLRLLNDLVPDANLVIGRELTKQFEEVLRGKPGELIKQIEDRKLKGE